MGALEIQTEVGEALYSFITTKLAPERRVAVVISGDLSHTYEVPKSAADLHLYLPDPR